MSVANFKSAAGELGLIKSQFDDCLDSGQYAQFVADSITEGTSYGVQGTPATFVNGTMVSGAQSFASFQSAVDTALAAS